MQVSEKKTGKKKHFFLGLISSNNWSLKEKKFSTSTLFVLHKEKTAVILTQNCHSLLFYIQVYSKNEDSTHELLIQHNATIKKWYPKLDENIFQLYSLVLYYSLGDLSKHLKKWKTEPSSYKSYTKKTFYASFWNKNGKKKKAFLFGFNFFY